MSVISSEELQLEYTFCHASCAGAKPDKLIQYYVACIRSMLEYGSVIFHPGLTKQQTADLEYVQKRALRIILPNMDYTDCLRESNLESLSDRRESNCLALFRQLQSQDHRLHNLLPPPNPAHYKLRKQRTYSTCGYINNRLCSEFVTYCINNFNTM